MDVAHDDSSATQAKVASIFDDTASLEKELIMKARQACR